MAEPACGIKGESPARCKLVALRCLLAKCIMTIRLPITKAALSDDEKWLATAGFDRKIVLYPLDKPDHVGYPLKGLSVMRVAFFKDAKGEKWVCGGGFSGEVGLWKIKEVEQGNLKGNLLPAFHNKRNETTRAGRLPLDRQDTAARGQALGICAISVYESPSGGLLAIASAKGKMQIWIIDELLSYLNQEIDLGDMLYDKANFKYDREAIGGTFTDMRFSHNGKGVLVTAGKESTSESVPAFGMWGPSLTENGSKSSPAFPGTNSIKSAVAS